MRSASYLTVYFPDMNVTQKTHPVHGRCLFLDNGVIEVGVPLDFGLRVCHFSFIGEKNVFFEQPNDMTALATEQGWRVRGGHRLWLAPEGPDVYAPDNDPISFTILPDGVEITQKEDPWLHVIKQMRLVLCGSSVRITHRVTNTAKVARCCSLWSISVMDGGGVEYIPLRVREGGFDPLHRFTLWDHSCLGDERATYKKDEIVLTHKPIDARYKLGVGHPAGDVRYENGNTVFIKHYELQEGREYPDGGMSYETFLCQYMTEVESLSPLYTLAEGESAEHDEVWTLQKKESI